MDFFKSKDDTTAQNNQTSATQKSGGGGLMDKLHGAIGGGPESERNEDFIDKGVDMFQEHVMGAGPQNNESAFEQAKDEQISDAIRRGYKSVTGADVPVKDK